MGDLAFGKSFNMMKDGVDHYFYKSTHMNIILIGIFSVRPNPFDEIHTLLGLPAHLDAA